MLQFLRVFLFGFSLILGLALAHAPAAAQQREEIALQRLDSDLRERLLRAARAEALRLDDETRVQLTTRDCPPTCNHAVMGGQCRCPIHGASGRCPPGTEPAPDAPPDSEVFCRTDPETVDVRGAGIPPGTQLRP
jgi:hypothetical protein